MDRWNIQENVRASLIESHPFLNQATMRRYISYFDLLGYKTFIQNNPNPYVRARVGHVLRDLEISIGLGKTHRVDGGIISDMSDSTINCLNISDTIVLYTNDESLESLLELLQVTFEFNWRLNCYHFPMRGCMIYDEIDLITGFQKNPNGGTYNINSIYGIGIVNAHVKAENLNFAGCVIDRSIVKKVKELTNVQEIMQPFTIVYNVPYKNINEAFEAEFTFKLSTGNGFNHEAFNNMKYSIYQAFTSDKKEFNSRAQTLFDNTITFLKWNMEANGA